MTIDDVRTLYVDAQWGGTVGHPGTAGFLEGDGLIQHEAIGKTCHRVGVLGGGPEDTWRGKIR